jgi:hypothetical protein
MSIPTNISEKAVWFNKLLDPTDNCKNLRAFCLNIFDCKLEKNQYWALRDMLDPKVRLIYYSSGRQSGKTQVLALYHVITALFPEFVILAYAGRGNAYIFAPKKEQAEISFERFSNFVHFNKYNVFSDSIVADKFDKMTFRNGFEVRAITASRNAEVEGLTTHIQTLDECLVSSCSIYTYDGKDYRKKTIKTIVENNLPIKVLSFNKITHSKEYKTITNYFKKPLKNGKIYKIRIKTEDGIKTLECTGEHKIMTNKGMIEAKNLTKNHRILYK